MKLMRKLEKQALARAAKEARRQQGELELYKVFLVSSTLSKSAQHFPLNFQQSWQQKSGGNTRNK